MPKTLTVETFNPLVNIKVVYPNFLYNVIPLLNRLAPEKSDANPTKYSATKLLNSLTNSEKTLFKFLYKAKTSEILRGTQIAQASVSSAVPLVLLAYRERYGVSYNSWDRTDKLLPFLLTENLAWLCKPEPYEFTEYSKASMLEEFLYQASTDSIVPQNTYKLSKTSDEQFNSLPKYQRMMLLQTWLYAPGVAHANMITDVLDWDKAPEAAPSVQTLAPW